MMFKRILDGHAIVYCQGAFNTPNGKTAHGLVRFTERYHIDAVIDSNHTGKDAGKVLDGKANGIPVVSSLHQALTVAQRAGKKIDYLVIGLAPDGGRLSDSVRQDIKDGLRLGLNIDSGLHDFLSEDPEIVKLAKEKGCKIRDIRKTPPRNELHFFRGNIEKVDCLKIAVLGTDSAVGKRTTAWQIIHSLKRAGLKAELVGTGQTSWMQGAKYSVIMDSMINDFVSGEIEDAVYQAWKNEKPDVIIIEGQGSLMNPAYPGGFEILAAARPDVVILQHAPKRVDYDGFPGYPIHPLSKQIEAIETISAKKVVAITVNHENMQGFEIPVACTKITQETGLPAFDVLVYGADDLAKILRKYIKK